MPEIPAGQLTLIIGMALVTYVPRVLPLWLLSSRGLHPALMRWLEMVPPAVLSALLAPSLFLHKTPEGGEAFFFSLDNVFLLASVPTFIVAMRSRSFLGTVAVGMGLVALIRQFL